MDLWDIIVEFEGGEREVVRGLTEAQQLALLRVFDRTELTVEAIEYDERHEETGKRNSLNR